MIAANNATQNRINCVKNLANAGSLQNAVGLGNAKGVKGWLAGAHPEHASAWERFWGRGIDFGRDERNRAGSRKQCCGCRWKSGGEQVPNVVSVNVNVATVSVSTATTTLTVQATTATARVYPGGSPTRGAVNTISGAFDGKLYLDIGVAVVVDYICLKDKN
jgi:hypothetical protein